MTKVEITNITIKNLILYLIVLYVLRKESTLVKSKHKLKLCSRRNSLNKHIIDSINILT